MRGLPELVTQLAAALDAARGSLDVACELVRDLSRRIGPDAPQRDPLDEHGDIPSEFDPED
jgi:hypothetical protein